MVLAIHALTTREFLMMDTHVFLSNVQIDFQSNKKTVHVFHAQPMVNVIDQMLWELSVFHQFVQRTASELLIAAAKNVLDTSDQIVILLHVFKTHVLTESTSLPQVPAFHAPTVKLPYQVNFHVHSPSVAIEIS